MSSYQHRSLKNGAGFTLIEMLVVVAIVGLLSSVVVIGVGGAREKSRDMKRLADMLAVRTWAEANYTNSYPDGTAWIGWSGKPIDPLNSGSNVYTYTRCTDTQAYVAKAVLEDAANKPSTGGLTGTPCGVTCSGSTDYCVGAGTTVGGAGGGREEK